jgi:hypothetical protein
VIGALEDAEDYKAFEAAIITDYDVQSAVEHELVLRLCDWACKISKPIDSLSRYEANLWRQAGRIPNAFVTLDRRKPQ